MPTPRSCQNTARAGWFLGNVFSYVPAARNSHQRDSVRVELNVSNGEAIVGIHDTGVGIATEMLGCIFDLFVQSTETLDRSEGGLGVVLTLVKKIIEHNGGTIDEHSDGPGQGSELTFRTPLVTAPGANGFSSNPHRERPAFELPQELNIAIIEDNVDSRSTLQTLLELDGHQIRSAGDGAQGVDLVLSWGSDTLSSMSDYRFLIGLRLPGRFSQHPGFVRAHRS